MDWWGMVLLAQEAGQAAAPAEPAAPPPTGPGLFEMLPPILAMVLLFYFLLVVPERRKSKQKQELLSSLKKNDRVLTVGGMYGVVANVKPGEEEVTLKIDEDKDVKVRITRSSITQVLSSKQDEKKE